ncbi:putative RNA methyltransferase [Bowmanella sp. JS7-9]|uniref:RNA methyltransferase n=1 Tax=Pseudobowmanella zhangzhouensis TaxID=1537679 RepID=A0ABW1XG89_9ALTE|nr:methyltransferase domain-containing protein [Bowmanella sp. JS7-9]TBX21362.1 hypothetical protein TK45_12470 [Bowmanella sp. JS7-9]
MTDSLYQCPVCQLPLTLAERTYRCDNGHSFDQHKKGYVNLLLVQNKRSKMPGDDADMVQSRRRFLNSGFYQPMAMALAELCKQQLPADARVWDAGCGEGYYTHIIASHNPGFAMQGLDISKPAIQAASQYKGIEWCVASSANPPYRDASIDGIVSVFSQVDAAAFARVLKPAGKVFLILPDADHLAALRALIYANVRDYDTSKHLSYLGQGFSLLSETRLEVPLALTSAEQIQDLIGMTPHAHRLSAEVRERLASLESLNDNACFKLYVFEKSRT